MPPRTLDQWLDWQSSLHPNAMELGLDRVRRVWQALGAPSLGAPVLTIAGTNGKGSSAAFAEAFLQQAGYRTGCYTSPHLQRYNERVRIDGVPVEDSALCAAFARIDAARGDTSLTYFEFGTLAALLVFAAAGLDAVVLEVGLGGRLDAVNIIDADVALITQIGLDHQAWLGDDTEAIGREKAGILRRGRPGVYAGRDMPASIARHAADVGASLVVAGHDFHVQRRADAWDLRGGPQPRLALPLPGMRGAVQVDNAAGVLVALGYLHDRLPLDQRAVRAALLGARVPGRFEVRSGQPTWVLDVAHNPQAVQRLDDNLADYFCRGQRIAVCGMLADKDVEAVGRLLARRFDRWHLLDLSDQPRGLSAAALRERLSTAVDPARLVVSPGQGTGEILQAVADGAGAEDLVVVFGSFVTVGRAMDWWQTRSVPG
jgi:dihydrofolate synthase/folylpolyglutamate synthase